MKRRVIGLDFDDVLMELHEPLFAYHNLNYGTKLDKDSATTYDIWDIFKCEREEAEQRIVDFYHSEHHHKASPVLGGPEAIKRLSQDNSLVIITSRPEFIQERTLEWLERHYPKVFDHVCFTNIFRGEGAVKKNKSKACEELGVDIFVDDNLDNAHDVASNGRPVLLLDAPWNRNVDLLSNITRVYDWEHILKVLG